MSEKVSLERYYSIENKIEEGLDNIREIIKEANENELDFIQNYLYTRYRPLINSVNKKRKTKFSYPFVNRSSDMYSMGECLGYCVKLGIYDHIIQIGEQAKEMKEEEDKKEYIASLKNNNKDMWKIMELSEKEYKYMESLRGKHREQYGRP